MKEFFTSFKNILITGLIVVVFLQRTCLPRTVTIPAPPPITLTDTVEKWDTLKITHTEYKPQWKIKIKIIYDTIPRVVDTVEILKDYYSKYIYQDTIPLDTFGYIVIQDTISQNIILSRNPSTSFRIPTKIITNTVEINRRQLYGGFNVGMNSSGFNTVTGSFLYKDRQDKVYQLGAGINSSLTPSIIVGTYWKILPRMKQ